MAWESRPVVLPATQRNQLQKIAHNTTSGEKEKSRAQIVLLLGEGLKNKEIAKRLGVHENTVVKWRGRWTGDNKNAKVADYGETKGRPTSVLVGSTLKRIEKLAKSKPPKGKHRWTVRSLAQEMNIPAATIQRALIKLNISPYDTTVHD